MTSSPERDFERPPPATFAVLLLQQPRRFDDRGPAASRGASQPYGAAVDRVPPSHAALRGRGRRSQPIWIGVCSSTFPGDPPFSVGRQRTVILEASIVLCS